MSITIIFIIILNITIFIIILTCVPSYLKGAGLPSVHVYRCGQEVIELLWVLPSALLSPIQKSPSAMPPPLPPSAPPTAPERSSCTQSEGARRNPLH